MTKYFDSKTTKLLIIYDFYAKHLVVTKKLRTFAPA